MSDSQGQDRKRSRRRSRSRRGKGGGDQQQQQHHNDQGGNSRRRRRNDSGGGGGGGNHRGGSDSYKIKTPKDKFGGREPIDVEAGHQGDGPLEVTAFELFCAYHLGITATNGYKRPVARDVARRFDISIDEMHEALRSFGMDNHTLEGCDFDISLARLDIRVAPEGIDRREIARVHYDELLEINAHLRQSVLEEAS